MNARDAKRGGTAPEGAVRRQHNQLNLNQNPYSLNQQNFERGQGGGSESNNSIKTGGNGGGHSSGVTHQNQMIAKIYGKSTKFVHNGGNTDQSKKQKL